MKNLAFVGSLLVAFAAPALSHAQCPASFAAAANYAADGPTSVAVGDFNADGRPDLAVANFSSNNVSILLGNAGGTFQAAVSYDVGIVPDSVAVGDFNADGRPDLAVANRSSNNVSVLLNTINPVVSQHPVPVSTCPAGAASFSVTATGGGPITYRWQREATPGTFVNLPNGRTTWDGRGGSGLVSGSDTRSLVIAADTASGLILCSGHAVRYRCIVTNSCGSVTSDAATLTICIGDADCDGDTDSDDVVTFFSSWDAGEPGGDADADGDTDSDDIIAFFAAWDSGC